VSFITGNLYAEEVMLPFGSFKLLEQVYNTSNVYGFYSRLAARAVKRIVETKFNSPVTLLEVGAGTGNGTENVLNQTNDRFKKYIFTDVSKSLVQMGRRRFKKKKYDFLEYQELDISGDSSFRTMQEQQIDIILGVNVFHATDDIICSLNNANRILKKGGILILSEIAPPCDSIYRYMEFTFGLLPSYSMYRDKDIRPLAPIIRPEQWANALEKTGFSDILTIPGTRSDKMDRGGIVIGIK
jgi:ubiquinone/menaquinone biosynthesis C-methylase UbiE